MTSCDNRVTNLCSGHQVVGSQRQDTTSDSSDTTPIFEVIDRKFGTSTLNVARGPSMVVLYTYLGNWGQN